MNPYKSPDIRSESDTIPRKDAQKSPIWWKNKRPFIIALIVGGIIHAFIPIIGRALHQSQDHLHAFMGFALNFIMLGWCSLDAKERTIRISGLLRFVLIFISLIGVPWYFLRSRGFVGAFKNVFGLGFLAIWLVTLFIVTFGIEILKIIQTK
jgi:hypothetical protein